MFKKILIANRGEIAVRIIRTCREMGIRTVAVYSEADRSSLHVKLADESVCIGSAPSKESYLKLDRILSATVASGAEAVHPGFGFLSENQKFSDLCDKCSIVFIGPSSRVMKLMGDKSEARNTAASAGVPVIPGTDKAVSHVLDGEALADQIGYPVMIKASLGGGGKGMRIVRSKEEFAHLFKTAQSEAKNAFGDHFMYIEKYIEKARHVEFQILADNYGNMVHLGERDCSIQRRHQKLIEEAPSPAVSQSLREKMGKAAIAAAKASGYHNAGTVEFLLDQQNQFYFIEMNTRIQVEHGITELVTGIDLVKEQIRIAAGEKLGYKQEDITLRGHAIECRINAESPKNRFMPCAGVVENFIMPGGFGVRVDTALYPGYEIPPYYDSLAAKIMVHAGSRQEAAVKMKYALQELVIDGIETNREFQMQLIESRKFLDGIVDTAFVEEAVCGGSEKA